MTNLIKKLFSALAAFAMLASLAGAQEVTAEKSAGDATTAGGTQDDVIVVTATKIEQAASEAAETVLVLSEQDIEQTGAHSIGEALNSILGLSFLGPSVGTAEPLQFRGFTDEYVKVLIDGIPITGADGGSVATSVISQISLDDVDHIEVLPGSSSALYGADAIAGVINIIRKKHDKKPLSVNVAQEVGTNKNVNGNASVAFNGNHLIAQAAAGYDMDDGTWNWETVQVGRGANITQNPLRSYDSTGSGEYFKWNARALLGWRFSEGRDISLTGTYNAQRLTYSSAAASTRGGSGTTYSAGYTFNNYSGYGGHVDFNWLLIPNMNLSGYFAVQQSNSSSYGRPYNGAKSSERKDTYTDWEGEARYEWDLGNWSDFLFGVNMLYSTYEPDSSEGYNVDWIKAMSMGLFAQDILSIGRFQIIPGVRFTFKLPVQSGLYSGTTELPDDEFQFNVSPKIALRFDPFDGLALKLSGGMGYRLPSITQKYNTNTGGLGDPTLKPETSYSVTLGADYSPLSWLTLNVSAYGTYLRDMIRSVALNSGNWSYYTYKGRTYANSSASSPGGTGGRPFRVYQNVGEVLSLGFDIGGTMTLGNWTASLGYEYLYMRRIDDGDLLKMQGKIPHQIKADVTYTVPWTKTRIGINGIWYAPSPSADDSDDNKSDYLVLNLRVDQPIIANTLTVYGGIKNFLNSISFIKASDGDKMKDDYSSYLTEDGITFYIGAKYTY